MLHEQRPIHILYKRKLRKKYKIWIINASETEKITRRKFVTGVFLVKK